MPDEAEEDGRRRSSAFSSSQAVAQAGSAIAPRSRGRGVRRARRRGSQRHIASAPSAVGSGQQPRAPPASRPARPAARCPPGRRTRRTPATRCTRPSPRPLPRPAKRSVTYGTATTSSPGISSPCTARSASSAARFGASPSSSGGHHQQRGGGDHHPAAADPVGERAVHPAADRHPDHHHRDREPGGGRRDVQACSISGRIAWVEYMFANMPRRPGTGRRGGCALTRLSCASTCGGPGTTRSATSPAQQPQQRARPPARAASRRAAAGRRLALAGHGGSATRGRRGWPPARRRCRPRRSAPAAPRWPAAAPP